VNAVDLLTAHHHHNHPLTLALKVPKMIFKSKFADVKPADQYKELVSNLFWDRLDTYRASVLFVDYETGRQWTGAQIKSTSSRLARQLIRHGLAANDDCVLFYKHSDYIQLAALGLLFAGASVCAGYDLDPEHEHAYMLEVMAPKFVFVAARLVDEMQRVRAAYGHQYTIVVMDDDSLGAAGERVVERLATDAGAGPVLGLHRDLLKEDTCQADDERVERLPVQVDPQRPAFILLTSGSTGRPKPVCRSQRNSLYVCHSLAGAEQLWELNESSVVAAHLALDHGTGIFQLKQCLARGYKSIIINGYERRALLDAIRRFRVTDVVLGSALVHNLLSSCQLELEAAGAGALADELGSLRNLIAVGSPIASPALVGQFMRALPDCSVRQAFGTTETGFLFVVPRELALDGRPELGPQIVGLAIPNVEFKLMSRETTASTADAQQPAPAEIDQFDTPGELYVRAPTVSPGYFGERFRPLSSTSFMPDGFYKTNDLCSVDPDGMLRVLARLGDVLCLGDGWKVLPGEIEHVIAEHPLVREAAVVGVPHPSLPTCHAPRAYVVPREGVQVVDDDDGEQEEQTAKGAETIGHQHQQRPADNDRQQNGHQAKQLNGNGKLNGHANHRNGAAKTISKRLIFEFVAERLAEPKHLVGGIKFVDELPKISIGKVDKRALKRADGYA
jgi:acyl-coenzyme A synthetase/AMP-(fatty) acid ligase